MRLLALLLVLAAIFAGNAIAYKPETPTININPSPAMVGVTSTFSGCSGIPNQYASFEVLWNPGVFVRPKSANEHWSSYYYSFTMASDGCFSIDYAPTSTGLYEVYIYQYNWQNHFVPSAEVEFDVTN